tara:strand:+ start:874 stop:1275 length:402 start_codon:yes stop_codon:yes gene_type:complete
MENRGRPSEQVERLDKWVLDDTDYTGARSIIKFDRSKSSNGPYSFENIPPKGFRQPKFKPEKGKAYGKQPVVLVFKTSNRSNAKTKIKVFKNENIDYIISADKLVGVPTTAEIIDIGVGISFIERYKQKYSLN